MTNQPDVTVAVNINFGFITTAPIGKPHQNPDVGARAAGRARGLPPPVSEPEVAV